MVLSHPPQMVPLFFIFFLLLNFMRAKSRSILKRGIYNWWFTLGDVFTRADPGIFFVFNWLYSISSRGWASRLQINGTSFFYSSFIPWSINTTFDSFLIWYVDYQEEIWMNRRDILFVSCMWWKWFLVGLLPPRRLLSCILILSDFISDTLNE